MAADNTTKYFKRILKKYGLSQDDFLEMLAAQESRCSICDRQFVLFSSDRREIPVVDHCHRSGEVRSLLCSRCNVAVGYLEKDEYVTYAALAYLGNPQDAYPRLKDEAREKEQRRLTRKQQNKEQMQRVLADLEKLLTGGPPGARLKE